VGADRTGGRLWPRYQGLRAAWAGNAVALVDFDAVCFSAHKLRAHLEGIRIECEYAQGRN
jgi:hypothetical protein